MARTYVKQAAAVEHLRGALGALRSGLENRGASVYYAVGYAESAIEQALRILVGPENTEDSPAYCQASASVQAAYVQDELPLFGDGS